MANDSENNTTLTPTSGDTIIDLFGETWALSGNRVLLNGKDFDATNSADLLVYANNVVYEHTLSNAWQSWRGPFGTGTPGDGVWIPVIGDPRGGGPTPTPQPTSPAPTPIPSDNVLSVSDTSTGKPASSTSQAYTGPVAGLQHEYINITPDSLNITATSDNWFIHSGAGTDAIAAHGGTNVLDGGTGSNFLTGGSGTDTFFVDARNASADIWSTTVNFHGGDSATVWGITAADFALQWADGQGAPGFTGLTLHATNPTHPTASLTLVGFSTADMASGRISTVFGTDAASGSSFLFIHANS
jgi:Ca2+-binding RTX toxin-like protein